MEEGKSRSYFRTEGIVLHSEKVNEADILATLITPGRGKIKGLLKSARRSRNRFRGNVEAGGVVSMMMYFRSHGLSQGRITDISVVEPLAGIRTDMKRILVMNYALDAVNAVVPMADPDSGLYGLLRDTLVLMEADNGMEMTAVILRVFEIKLLVKTGIHPDLGHCSSCGGRISARAYFSLSDLAVLCGHCRIGYSGGHLMAFDPGFLAFYEACVNKGMAGILRQAVSESVEKQARLFFRRIFMDYLGKSLKVPKVARGLV